MILAHLLYALHRYLALQVLLVNISIAHVFLLLHGLLDQHNALVLINRTLVEIVLFLVGEHVNLVQQLLQGAVERVVLII